MIRQIMIAMVSSVVFATAGMASPDEMNLGDPEHVIDMMKGFGSAKGPECENNGACLYEGRADGNKYFLRIFGDDGERCKNYCTGSLLVCNTDWKLSDSARTTWLNDHWTIANYTTEDGECLSLYLNAFVGNYTKEQVEAAFELYHSDLKELLKKVE